MFGLPSGRQKRPPLTHVRRALRRSEVVSAAVLRHPHRRQITYVRGLLRARASARMRRGRTHRIEEDVVGEDKVEQGSGEKPAQDGNGELREEDVTAEDRIDEGDLSESEKLPGDE